MKAFCKKLCIYITGFSLFLFLAAPVFSQEVESESSVETETITDSERDYVDEQNMAVSDVEELIQSQSLINRIDLVFGLTPSIIVNTHTKDSAGSFISGPSPVVMPVYIGLSIPNYTAVSFQPSLRFFTTFNLVYGDMVLPAEIENRTGHTFCFLINLPVAFKYNIKNKYSWTVLAGLAGLIRFAAVPVNMEGTESGYTGSVKSDIDYMNKWFYQNMRFLYLSAATDWLFYYGKTKFGPELSLFLPVSLIADKSADGLMLGLGFKVEF